MEFIDLGNECLLSRFGNNQDKMLVFDQRPWFINGLNLLSYAGFPSLTPIILLSLELSNG